MVSMVITKSHQHHSTYMVCSVEAICWLVFCTLEPSVHSEQHRQRTSQLRDCDCDPNQTACVCHCQSAVHLTTAIPYWILFFSFLFLRVTCIQDYCPLFLTCFIGFHCIYSHFCCISQHGNCPLHCKE